MKKGFLAAGADVKKFEAATKAATARLGKMAIAAGVVGAIGIAKFAKFDKSIREIGTLLGRVTDEDIKRMGEEVKSMSAKFGQSVEKMAKAKYDIISAGFTDAAESAELLDVAARLASAGVTTVAKTADVLTSVLNAYGRSAKDAEHFSDVLFTTVRLGKTTVDQLASGLGRAAAIAPQVNVSFEELSAGIATLTAGGQSTDEVMTSMVATMSAMLKPMPALSARLKALGFDTGSAAFESLGFAGTLERLTEEMTETEIASFFPNIRALKGIFPLTGTLADKFTENVKAMDKTAGATDKAFGVMADGIAFRFSQMGAEAENALISIGENLLPVAEGLLSLLEGFTKLDPAMQTAIITFGLLTIVVGSFATAITIALGPVGLLYAAAGILAAAVGTYVAVSVTATEETGKLGDATETAAGKMKIMKNRLDELNMRQLEVRVIQVTNEIKRLAKKFQEGGMGAAVYSAELRTLKIELKATKKALDDFDKRGAAAADPDPEDKIKAGLKFATWEAYYASLDEAAQTKLETEFEAFDTVLEYQVATDLSKLESDMMYQNTVKENAKKKRIAMLKFLIQERMDKEAAIKRQIELDKLAARAKVMAIRTALNDIASLFGKHTAIAKGALMTQALMDTYAAANRALASLPPPWSFIAAAAAVAAGLSNVAKISAMARGGIVEPIRAQTGIVSAGFDSVPALLRPGEAVIPTETARDNLPAIRQLIAGQSISDGGGGGGLSIQIVNNISAIDSQGVAEFVESGDFKDAIVDAINDEKIRLNAGTETVTGVF